MLVDSIYDGKSAAEILEETKKYYVKTRELKENKIDLSTPRLFKSPSEEEMEQIVSELRKRPSIKYPIPSSALRVTQSFCSPTTFGTAFCITGSTELPNRMQSFSTSATSAFEPVIRTPPRPPKSEKIREKQKLQIQPDIASTSTNLELPPRPIPPPRRSLQKSNSRPIPPPRQRISMTTSYHSPLNFIPFESISSSEDASNNLFNALSTPNLMNNSICCSSFEPYFASNNSLKPQDLMTSSWYGPLTSSTKLQPIKHIPHRIRIPVKPHQLTVTVIGAKNNSSHTTTLPKLIKPIPIRSPDSAFKVMRSQSSITPSRLSSFHSPGTTSGAGTASGTSLSNPSVSEFQIQNTNINKHILSSPTASKDSGAHDCSIIGSEVEIDESALKQVDKDFEDRIKRWDSYSAPHQRISSQQQAIARPSIPPPIAPKPILTDNHDFKSINKFFDRCGFTSTTNSTPSETKVNDIEDIQSQSISSVDSNFTSITDNKAQLDTNEMEHQTKDCNESDAEQQQKTTTNVASKPVSIIEKNARVIQWIHGCTLASTVC
uniref:Centrosome-associated FAM110 C-terminal domain-containing protein n=1 Tax=Panagrolaimus superbus TaxID=310955 RepID=A0A914Z0U1_9BILA